MRARTPNGTPDRVFDRRSGKWRLRRQPYRRLRNTDWLSAEAAGLLVSSGCVIDVRHRLA